MVVGSSRAEEAGRGDPPAFASRLLLLLSILHFESPSDVISSFLRLLYIFKPVRFARFQFDVVRQLCLLLLLQRGWTRVAR